MTTTLSLKVAAVLCSNWFLTDVNGRSKMLRLVSKIGVFCFKLILLCSAIPLVIVALPFSWIAITVIAIGYSLGIGLWLYTAQGRFYRILKSQKSRLKAISRRGLRKRKRISDDRNSRNMSALLKIVQTTLNDRKDEIPINILVQIRLMLRECKKDLDFEKTLRLYHIVVEVEPALLSDALNGRNI